MEEMLRRTLGEQVELQTVLTGDLWPALTDIHQVSELAKDDKSIWRGHAMKDGKAVDVALDYQGNITAN